MNKGLNNLTSLAQTILHKTSNKLQDSITILPKTFVYVDLLNMIHPVGANNLENSPPRIPRRCQHERANLLHERNINKKRPNSRAQTNEQPNHFRIKETREFPPLLREFRPKNRDGSWLNRLLVHDLVTVILVSCRPTDALMCACVEPLFSWSRFLLWLNLCLEVGLVNQLKTLKPPNL